jgi:hypothetical protein
MVMKISKLKSEKFWHNAKEETKYRLKIHLGCCSDRKTNNVFDIYRMAVELNLAGFIRRKGAENLEIETEANDENQQMFLSRLMELAAKQEITTDVNRNDILLNYNEFRILKH